MQSKPHSRTALIQDLAGSSAPNHTPLDDAKLVPLGLGRTGRYGLCPVNAIIENKHAVRTHSKRQVEKIGHAMKAAGPLAPQAGAKINEQAVKP